ncbi:MAG: hypothetical protein PUC32_01475 [Oscillospiraceae bacterium]|nr:hypothetical protein [Oscillospiraceae bacterium]
MDNVIAVFSNPVVIVVICVAFGSWILGFIWRLIKRKFLNKKPKGHMSAEYVRDAVKKYDDKNKKES